MKSITILMSTYNGEKYLEEQLESLLGQKNCNLKILVRDDGSSDDTIKILERYKKKELLDWYKGSNLKSANSFMDLIKNAPKTDYYAFCDQDDVWNNDKIEIAIDTLEKIGNNEKPLLYCSNYELVDEALVSINIDNHHKSSTNFSDAIVGSCCTGCTVVFNQKLIDYLRKEYPKNILMHDDWAHKVCLAVGGIVYYDERPMLKYRQHKNNVDGGVHNIKKRIKNILKRIREKDCIRSKQIENLVKIYGDYMSKKNKIIANEIIQYKHYNIIKRIKLAYSKEFKKAQKRLLRGFRAAIIFKYY